MTNKFLIAYLINNPEQADNLLRGSLFMLVLLTLIKGLLSTLSLIF